MWNIIFFLFILTVESSGFRDYELKYKVKIVYSKLNNTLVNECAFTSAPKGYKIAKEEDDIKFTDLYFDPLLSFCSPSNITFDKRPAVMVINPHICGLVRQIRHARMANVKLLLLVSSTEYLHLPDIVNEFNQYPIVSLLSTNTFDKIIDKRILNDSKVGIYGSMGDNSVGDAITGIILFSIITISVIIIIFISVVFNKEHFESMKTVAGSDTKNMKWIVLICPLMMVGILLLLYFFYNVFVWVLISFFFLVVAFSITSFLMLFVSKFNILPSYIYPVNKYGIKNVDYRAIGIFVLGLSVSTVWIVNRNNMTGLVLNNIIGIFLCGQIAVGFGIIFVASRHFRLLLLLLATTLIIDVLMVYIRTPGVQPTVTDQLPAYMRNDSLIRSKRDAGNSIMERVATGTAGSSKEEIPIRFKIPRIDMNYKLSSARCQNYTKSYSMVGFGDVILPGAFIAYMLTFAVMATKSTALYSVFMLFWYIVGLAITYIVVMFTQRGQPALVFLLPSTVPTTLLLAVIKKDFMSLWNETWTENLMGNLKNIDDEQLISDVTAETKSSV